MGIKIIFTECPKCNNPLVPTIGFFVESEEELVWAENDFSHYRCTNQDCRWHNPR